MEKPNRKVFLILHNIRSVYNVGAIFRTADAAGVSKIYLTGYTPTPHDRFGRSRKDLAKTALGAEKIVQWEYFKNPITLFRKLKLAGARVVALEQTKDSLDYKKIRLPKRFALVVGNEVGGIAENILNVCDSVIDIPMRGEKESLNVSVATGIALFRLLGI